MKKVIKGLICLLAMGILAGTSQAEWWRFWGKEAKAVAQAEVKENLKVAEAESKPVKATEEKGTQTAEAQVKAKVEATRKILVLHIIEENWDDLEFILPKYKRVRGVKFTITKKEALKDYREFKEKAIKKDVEIKGIIKGSIMPTMKLAISQGTISKDSDNRLYVKHEIVYIGKAYYLKEEDTFIKSAFRGKAGDKRIISDYYYERLPKKISLLLEPKYFDKTCRKFLPHKMNNFEEIRLVDDLYILSVDNSGNLKIKYNDKKYTLKVGSVLELPIKETILTRDEMMKFKERYFEYYAKEYRIGQEEYKYILPSFLEKISIPNERFRFGTKVTIINYGFEEIQGD